MPEAPAGLTLADAGVQIIDANGDGRSDLLVSRQSIAGYFPMRFDGGWDRHAMHRYAVAPTFSLSDPEVRLIDLTGVIQLPAREVSISSAFASKSFEHALEQRVHIFSGRCMLREDQLPAAL